MKYRLCNLTRQVARLYSEENMIKFPEHSFDKMERDEALASIADQLAQLGSDYQQSYINTACDYRLASHAWTRDGVQKLAWIQFLIESLIKALETAMNDPGTFYTESERDPASPEYVDLAWEECPDFDTQQMRRGYQALFLLMVAAQYLGSSGDDNEQSDRARLFNAKDLMVKALKTRRLPPCEHIRHPL
jgi:hypothetical protein